MAKRRKSLKRKSTGRRRGRVSGVGSQLMPLALNIGGAVLGSIVQKQLDEKMNLDKYSGAILVAAGLFLPKFVKNPMVKDIAAGMAIAGGLALVKQTGVINGLPMIGYNAPLLSAQVAGTLSSESAQVAGVGCSDRSRYLSGIGLC